MREPVGREIMYSFNGPSDITTPVSWLGRPKDSDFQPEAGGATSDWFVTTSAGQSRTRGAARDGVIEPGDVASAMSGRCQCIGLFGCVRGLTFDMSSRRKGWAAVSTAQGRKPRTYLEDQEAGPDGRVF